MRGHTDKPIMFRIDFISQALPKLNPPLYYHNLLYPSKRTQLQPLKSKPIYVPKTLGLSYFLDSEVVLLPKAPFYATCKELSKRKQ